MFSHIVVTAANEQIATVVQSQLDHLVHEYRCKTLSHVELHCFADPAGTRIGSGGGTLHAALSLLEKTGLEDFSGERVLILHSGGDARRSPMYTVCGKAWMSLNMVYESGDTVLVANALLLLLDQLDGLARRCPLGSLVVASGDVLVSLSQNWGEFSFEIEDDVVYVVTVPAPVSTAKNHGVLFNHGLKSQVPIGAAVLTCPVDLY
eukprot:gene18638-22459_t